MRGSLRYALRASVERTFGWLGSGWRVAWLVFGGLGLGGLEPGLGVEERAVHAADPFGGFAGGAVGGLGVGELVAEGLEFGFEVVQGAEQHGLGGHGKFGAAEFQLAVVGEDHVLDEETELRREGLRG
jgi:hypothetical protein